MSTKLLLFLVLLTYVTIDTEVMSALKRGAYITWPSGQVIDQCSPCPIRWGLAPRAVLVFAGMVVKRYLALFSRNFSNFHVNENAPHLRTIYNKNRCRKNRFRSIAYVNEVIVIL